MREGWEVESLLEASQNSIIDVGVRRFAASMIHYAMHDCAKGRGSNHYEDAVRWMLEDRGDYEAPSFGWCCAILGLDLEYMQGGAERVMTFNRSWGLKRRNIPAY